jgi:hypothetical protein
MRNYLEGLLRNISQKGSLKDIWCGMPGEKMAANGVRLPPTVLIIFPFTRPQSNGFFSLLTVSLLAIIHIVAALTVFGYAQHYYFHFSKHPIWLSLLKKEIFNINQDIINITLTKTFGPIGGFLLICIYQSEEFIELTQ